LSILRGFRRYLEAIEALTSTIKALNQTQLDLGPALDRLEALERSRHHFEAECEGFLLKADGHFKAAASAEARERQLKKANDRLADPLDPDGVAGEEPVFPDHAAPGEAPRVPAVHLALATNDKAHAVRAKFGI